MKKLVALVLAACLLLGLMSTVLAADLSDDIVILYTNDVHTAVDDNIGYAGLAAYKKEMQAAHKYVALVDCGDAVQGAAIGTLSKGEYLVDIMNQVGYDYASFGNHEFDYTLPQLQKLINKAKYQYLCCNLTYTGKDNAGLTGYKPYAIATYGETKIAYVGIDTPESFTKSTPTYFQDANGNYVYSFAEGDNGANLYKTVQETVDAAKKDGATYVVAIAHLGVDESSEPYRSTDVIANTTGIDAMLDGHSHSTIAMEMVKNKDGKEIPLSSTGTKLVNIGKLTISDGKFTTELISDYTAKDDATDAYVKSIQDKNNALLNSVVAKSSVTLTTKRADGTRAVRNRETNLGDLCADAYRVVSGADIALVNGGGIRADIKAGNITYGAIIAVHPYGNALCVVEATGQEIIDALEWTARNTMSSGSDGENAIGEMGGFLQVSGLKYTIDTTVKSSAKGDDKSMFVSVDGAYRVKNVKVLKNGKYVDIDPKATYKVASHNYMLKDSGDGINMFADNKLLQDSVMLDNEVLINYIKDNLGGVVPASYAQPQGRITIISTPYTDVTDGTWAVDAVNYVTDKNLMNGTSDTAFSPNTPLTRGMLVTVLYRMAGSPTVTGKVSEKFTDCTDGSWYADAVLWANEKGIVTGYENGTFDPTRAITRQEMAKVLYGYDKAMGKAGEEFAIQLAYSDLASIGDWALESVTYCAAAKYFAHTAGASFNPRGYTTRAMGAQVLMNMTSDAK